MSRNKKNKKPHEMLKETAIYAAYQRILRGGFDESKIYSKDEERLSVHGEIRQKLLTSMTEHGWFNHNANHFYECVDGFLATILHPCLDNGADAGFLADHTSFLLDSFQEVLLKRFHNRPPGFAPLGDAAVPAFKSYMRGHVNLTVAVINWLTAGKHVYTIAPNLSEMLKHTKLDRLKAKHIRLPFRTVYISPPKETWSHLPVEGQSREMWGLTAEEVDGVLISEVDDDGKRNLNFMVMAFVQTRTGKSIMGLDRHLRLKLEDDETLSDILEGQLQDMDPVFQHIFRYITSVAVYTTSTDADQILASTSPEYAAWIKEMQRYPPGHREKKAIEQIVNPARSTNTYYLGGSLKINRHNLTAAVSDDKKGTHASPVPHYRSGHFRAQPYGSKDIPQYRTIWIQPQIIGMSRGTIKNNVQGPAIREVT